MWLWLEEVEGDEALAWVREQNERSTAVLESHPWFETLQADAFEVLTSPDALPWPALRGGMIYNFWRDAEHERGIWRRTTTEGYREATPPWEVLLDVDALAADEEQNWVWGGSQCLHPTYDRCLVSLSIGGADASVRREFDLESRSFVDDGFQLPESKSRLQWRDRDSVFVAPALADDDLTDSGYPRRVFLWTRGTDLEAAELLLEGERTDVSVSGWRSWDGDTPHDFLARSLSFYTRLYYLFHEGSLYPIPIPEDARLVGGVQGQLLVELKSEWEVGSTTFPQGALLSAPLEGVRTGELVFEVLLQPGPRQSIDQLATTQNHLLVLLLDNVEGQLHRFTFTDGAWQREALSVPSLGALRLLTTDDASDQFYYTYAGFLDPSRIVEANAASDAHRTVRASPQWFDAEGMRVEQRHARSADGTEVPYFVVFPATDVRAGETPVLLYAYGGFEVSQTPFYSGVLGRNWLARGGVYVLANLRGGGEFGPAWHRAALRENRQLSFDDMIAVAEDLIEAGIATPATLGIQGGSNGGLLTGAVMVQRPELFGAVVSAVPLLDMLRYHRLLAGASWMAEYGDPDDPADRTFLEAYSPLQNLRADVDYPVPFFWTSTRDDRVHPGHARRMAARMMELGHEVFYFENIEGGHGGAANQRQRAYISALTYSYLHRQLRPGFVATAEPEMAPEADE